MRTSADLPLVSCELSLSDGVADIESFRRAATSANWTNDEINVAVVQAIYESSYFDDVGVGLQQYCACRKDARTQQGFRKGRCSPGAMAGVLL
jgi:hypothetical protein